jgi:hypothetical protein
MAHAFQAARIASLDTVTLSPVPSHAPDSRLVTRQAQSPKELRFASRTLRATNTISPLAQLARTPRRASINSEPKAHHYHRPTGSGTQRGQTPQSPLVSGLGLGLGLALVGPAGPPVSPTSSIVKPSNAIWSFVAGDVMRSRFDLPASQFRHAIRFV